MREGLPNGFLPIFGFAAAKKPLFPMKRAILSLLLPFILSPLLLGQSQRECTLFDDGWKFAFGNASDLTKDFGCGTEYFNYLTKAASIHNEGPYSPKFDPGKWENTWKEVTLPHDWVVDLPFAAEASHSHGYKTVGWKYPENSVGWYRKTFTIPAEDKGKDISLRFDGIFRDSQVWVNGFWMGGERSGYASDVYDITPYLNYGGENVVCVRVDASLEEGWFYEGAGIYRDVYLLKTSPVRLTPFGAFFHADFSQGGLAYPTLFVEATVLNSSHGNADCSVRCTLYDASGKAVVSFPETSPGSAAPCGEVTLKTQKVMSSPHLWSVDDPYLYTLETSVLSGGKVVDTYSQKVGIRKVSYDPDKGLFLNDKSIKITGVNMHQDHAGVGAAIPPALSRYRLSCLKALGCNAYRSSHNPMDPSLLDECDRMGFLVVEENRLTGINEEHMRLLGKMIRRDRSHPSIIMWSVGNEEWGMEWNDFGPDVVRIMKEKCHLEDPTRMMTVATSGGPRIVETADVAGYNYILQNPVEKHREAYPSRIAYGSEETSGCGSRGIYFDDYENGRMTAINRHPQGPDSLYNCIERGWQFYRDRPYLLGLFYWTGFDYRGEPNPLKFPAKGSEFGILDYCGFPKDEAFYLKAAWRDEPLVHIFPHWNLSGHEGEQVDVWAYSNCDEVELFVNGKSVGRKPMPKDGHLSWKVTYNPGSLKAVGYKGGKEAARTLVPTTGKPSSLEVTSDRGTVSPDGRDVAVCTVRVLDSEGRVVPDACEEVSLKVSGDVCILGVGNGDPAWQDPERPSSRGERTFSVKTFGGLAQVILQSRKGGAGDATLEVSSGDLKSSSVKVTLSE